MNPQALTQYRKTQNELVALAERELNTFWKSLDKSNAVQAARLLEAFLPELISVYGEMGAVVASDFYDELREESPDIDKAYRAVLGESVPLDQAAASTRWAVGPMFGGTGEATTLSNLLDVTDRLIKQHGTNTVLENSLRDPQSVRYARVPTGTDTCSYCNMLASRGAVYASEQTAKSIGKRHGKCDCVATPVWGQRDLDDLYNAGYDPDAHYEKWQEAISEEKASA